MNKSLQRGFQLDDKRIYPATGEIISPGGTRHVQPETMKVLVCLAEQQGAVVDGDLIWAQVWGESACDPEDLSRCISELRYELGDSNAEQKIISTVNLDAYRLVSSVHSLSSTGSPVTESKPLAKDPPGIALLIANLRRRRVFRALGAYAIVIWVAVQVAATAFPPLGIPGWGIKLVVWAAVLGFPIVAILSWTLQVTEKGIEIDDTSGTGARLLTNAPGRMIDFTIIGVLVLIVSFLIYERTVSQHRPIVILTEQGEITLPELTPDVVDPWSIAVLPFANLGEDPRLEYLALGLAEEVLSLLANIRELKVPSRASSFYYQGKNFDIENIASQLRVSNVLEGSIQGPVDELEISAQLTVADSGYQVWSQSFAPRNTDVLAVRDEIARAVVDSLKVALSIESQNRIMRRPTNSADAYDFYLQALSYLRRPRSEQTLDNAEGLFRRALDLDPDYALAYAGLCNVYLGKYRLSRQTQHVEPAEQSCTSALSLNPDLGEVHIALGSLYRHTGKYESAEREFQQAIVLNPKLEPAYYGLAMTYKAQDRLDESENIFRYAVNLEPGYWGTYLALGNYYLEFGRPEEAIPLFRRVTEINPEYALGYNNLGAALYNSGDLEGGEAAYLKSLEIEPSEFGYANMGSVYYNAGRYVSAVDMFRQAVEFTPNDYRNWGRLAFAQRFVLDLETEAQDNFQTAIEIATAALEINPNDWRALAYLSSYYANVGNTVKSLSTLDQALEYGPNDPHVHYFGAVANMALGDPAAALQFLENAARLGYSTNAIASDPDFEALRETDRFEALLAAGGKRIQ